MKLEQLQRRIARAEAVMAKRERLVRTQWQLVRGTWREAWTPMRIVLAGLGLGFVAGRTRPLAAAGELAGRVGGAPKLMQAISAISALVASFRAGDAAESADAAREGARDAAVEAGETRTTVEAASMATARGPAHEAPPYEVPETFRDQGHL